MSEKGALTKNLEPVNEMAPSMTERWKKIVIQRILLRKERELAVKKKVLSFAEMPLCSWPKSDCSAKFRFSLDY